MMKTLNDLESRVASLSADEYIKFRDWFWEYEQQQWDVKIENDIADKKLETLAAAALKDFKDGKYSAL